MNSVRFSGQFVIDKEGPTNLFGKLLQRLEPDSVRAYEAAVMDAVKPYDAFIKALPDEVVITYKAEDNNPEATSAVLIVDINTPHGSYGYGLGCTIGEKGMGKTIDTLKELYEFTPKHRKMIQDGMAQVFSYVPSCLTSAFNPIPALEKEALSQHFAKVIAPLLAQGHAEAAKSTP